MAVKKLSLNIQSLFSSAIHIFSYKRAVEELIYNALDAQSTSVAVRINIEEKKIQVVDNGCGISKDDFEFVGQKHATSKFVDFKTYKSAANSYGFRGQSLAGLAEVSKCVKITSRVSNTEETWTKTLYKGRRNESTQTTIRPSKGTTIEVNGFLYNQNIQNKCINPITEINDIKTLLEQLSLVHNNVSFSLRDDCKNEIVFKTHKNSDIYQTFKSLFDIEKDCIQELQVEKNEYKLVAYVAKTNDHPDRHHWVYLNKKIVYNPKLHKIVYDNLLKSIKPSCRMTRVKSKNHVEDYEPSKNQLAFYFIFITCPYYDYDISNSPKQSTLQFKNWNQITKLIEKLVKFHKGELKVKEIKRVCEIDDKNIITNENKKDDTRQEVKEIMKKILGSQPKKVGVSQMQNGIKGKLIKRKKKTAKLSFSRVVPHKDSVIKKSKHVSDDTITHQTIGDISKVFETEKPTFINERNQIATVHTIHSSNYNNNKKCISRSTKINKSEGPKLKNKIQKHVKKKNKAKKDPLVEIFRKKPDEVLKRCKLLAKEVENLILHNNNRNQDLYVNESVSYSNITRNNKNISIRKQIGEIIIHEFIPLKPDTNPKNTNYTHSNDKREATLKTSYDLLKCVTDTINNENSLGSYKEDNQEENLKRNKEQPINQDVNTMFTYQSHHYTCNGISSHQHNIRNENIVASKKPFDHCKNGQSSMRSGAYVLNDEPETKYSIISNINKFIISDQNAKSDKNSHPKKIQIIEKSKATTKQFNIKSFSDNVTSHTIEFSDSRNDQKESGKYYHPNCDPNIDFNRTYDVPNIKFNNQKQRTVVTSTIGLTYTLTSSNIFSDTINESLGNNDYNESNWTLTYSKREQICANKTEYPKADNLNVIFVSNNSNTIEPLNVCEITISNQSECKQNEFNPGVSDFNIIGDNTLQVLQAQSTIIGETNYGDNTEVTETRNKNGLDTLGAELDQIIEFENQQEAVCKAEESGDRAFTANDFGIRNRPRFLPKGMSPIFDNHCMKNKNDMQLERGYFADDLYNKFKDEVQTNTEVYEVHVQDSKDLVSKNIIKVNSRLEKDNCSLTFSAESLKNAKVLGQIDNKFIASIMKGNTDQTEFLVLFDQHAVHERIRLEENLEDYFSNNEWKRCTLDDVLLKMSKDEILYLHNFKDKFTQFGLDWTIQNNYNITLHSIPAAILGKNSRPVEKVISSVRNLISEEINIIRSQKGCVSLYPKSIMDLIFSEACRYAIKFGDKLPHRECVELVRSLSTCKTPFQCAHGRPVMAVIMDVQPKTRNYQINMKNLRKL